MIVLGKSFKSANDIPLNNWDEDEEILSEWSTETKTFLETLRSERTKISRHMHHLNCRIKFLEESFPKSRFTKECLEKLNGLQLELSSLEKSILSKEKLLNHINT